MWPQLGSEQTEVPSLQFYGTLAWDSGPDVLSLPTHPTADSWDRSRAVQRQQCPAAGAPSPPSWAFPTADTELCSQLFRQACATRWMGQTAVGMDTIALRALSILPENPWLQRKTPITGKRQSCPRAISHQRLFLSQVTLSFQLQATHCRFVLQLWAKWDPPSSAKDPFLPAVIL